MNRKTELLKIEKEKIIEKLHIMFDGDSKYNRNGYINFTKPYGGFGSVFMQLLRDFYICALNNVTLIYGKVLSYYITNIIYYA